MRRTLPAFQRIMRLSERTVGQGYELKVKDIMSGVRQQVLTQPGLINVETLVDTSDPNKLLVLTEWKSKEDLNTWLASPLCLEVSERLNTVLDTPPKYQEFRNAEDEVFLL